MPNLDVLSAVPSLSGDDKLQERLINRGYALCDASVRTWFDTSLPAASGFPYPASGV